MLGAEPAIAALRPRLGAGVASALLRPFDCFAMTHPRALEALKIFAKSPCGDVRAARSCAITLLADLQSDLARRLTLRGLSAMLASLSKDGSVRRAWAGSPSLLVQYVAAAAQEGELDPALSAAPNLLVTAEAWEGRAPAHLRAPFAPPSGRVGRTPQPESAGMAARHLETKHDLKSDTS